MRLNEIRDKPGATHAKKRLGRGGASAAEAEAQAEAVVE